MVYDRPLIVSLIRSAFTFVVCLSRDGMSAFRAEGRF
jgi:hypothetical protein